MTLRPSSFSHLAAIALLVATGGMAQAQTAPVNAALRAGTAKLVNGQVVASNSGGDRVLAPGDPVLAADRVTTGPGSSASLVLRDGTVIVLGPASRMDLREFTFDTTTYEGNMVVSVLRGTMRMVSGLIRKTRSDAVSIETPTALIGIRGTDFIVDVDPAEAVQ